MNDRWCEEMTVGDQDGGIRDAWIRRDERSLNAIAAAIVEQLEERGEDVPDEIPELRVLGVRIVDDDILGEIFEYEVELCWKEDPWQSS